MSGRRAECSGTDRGLQQGSFREELTLCPNGKDEAQSLGLGIRMFSLGFLPRNLTLFSAPYLEPVQCQQEPPDLGDSLTFVTSPVKRATVEPGAL